MNVEASRRTIALDTESGQLPEGLLLPPERGGEVVVLLVDAEFRRWASEASHALARGWTVRGRKVVVMDGDFTAPILSLPDEQGPVEGVADALFFGASPERISLPVPGAEHLRVSVGTVVPDAARAWGSEAWSGLLDRFRAAHQVVLLLLPGNREGVAPLLPLADRTFRVGREIVEGGRPFPLLHPADMRPLLPGGIPLEEGASFDPDEETEEVAGMTRADQGSLAEKPEAAAFREAQAAQAARFADAGMPGAGGRAPGGVEESSAPVAPAPRPTPPSGSRRRIPWIVLLLVLVFVVALLLSWTGVMEIPGLPFSPRVDPAG